MITLRGNSESAFAGEGTSGDRRSIDQTEMRDLVRADLQVCPIPGQGGRSAATEKCAPTAIYR
jgi:hypothetical protein